MRIIGMPSGNIRWMIQTVRLDGSQDRIELRVPRPTRVALIGSQLVQGYANADLGQRVAGVNVRLQGLRTQKAQHTGFAQFR